MIWRLSHRAEPAANAIALAAPGAVWGTSAPMAEYVRHAWAGAWVCSIFRNERPDLYRSSDLVREACAASRALLGDPPPLGMVTFVNRDRTRPKRDPGRCFRRAGFEAVGETKGGLVALQLRPDAFPQAALPIGATAALF